MKNFSYKGFIFLENNDEIRVDYKGENILISQFLWGDFTIFNDEGFYNNPEFISNIKMTIDEILYRFNSLYNNGDCLQSPYNKFFPLYPDFIKMFKNLGFHSVKYPSCYDVDKNKNLHWVTLK